MTNPNAEPEFQKIGSLLPPISNSASPKGTVSSTLSGLPTHSGTTGSPSRELEASNSTGRLHGGIGSVATLAEMPTDLAAHPVAVIEASLRALLPPGVMQALSPQWRDNVGEYGFDGEIIGYDVGYMADADWARAVELLTIVNTPCPPGIAATAVTTLALRTKSRKEDGGDMRARTKLYAHDLQDYPADIVVETCRRWAESETFFPGWAELRDGLEWRVRKRRLMLEALSNRMKEYGEKI